MLAVREVVAIEIVHRVCMMTERKLIEIVVWPLELARSPEREATYSGGGGGRKEGETGDFFGGVSGNAFVGEGGFVDRDSGASTVCRRSGGRRSCLG